MSTPVSPSKTREQKAKPFNDMIRKMLVANINHISKTDWLQLPNCKVIHSIQDPKSTDLWVFVPEDDNSIYESLIKAGYSYAFVSLLQVCARNQASWIFFSDDNLCVAGIHEFEEAEAPHGHYADVLQ